MSRRSKAIDLEPWFYVSFKRQGRHMEQKILKQSNMDLPISDLNLQPSNHKSNALYRLTYRGSLSATIIDVCCYSRAIGLYLNLKDWKNCQNFNHCIVFNILNQSGIPPPCKQPMFCVEFGTLFQRSPFKLVWYICSKYF